MKYASDTFSLYTYFGKKIERVKKGGTGEFLRCILDTND